ncbi:MAG: site-2 protease family protein [Oscillospiraceae bacterium]|nr:site-2 protease family protein [Oscillospiraceae bacterium]
MYIVLAVIAFGVLIFVHELGHFLMAKACGVKVVEFAIGMGPQLLHKQKGETVYSLRALPIGGFCAMEGEEEESADPRAFNNHSVWHRLLILLSGSGMNFLTGFLLICILFSSAGGFTSNRIAAFYPNCPYEGDLQVGDAIRSVNGHRIYFTANFSEYASQDGDGDLDLVIRRDGKTIRLNAYHMVPVEYQKEDGTTERKYGLYFATEEANALTVVKYSFYNCMDFVRMVWQGLVQLFTGKAAVTDMAGVVGIVDIINETGESAETVSQGLSNITYLVAFIAVNLSVMNLLPIPALDGGHILTLLVSAVIEKLSGKKPDPRIEAYIHAIGLVLLLALMAFVLFNDVTRILKR